MCISYCQERQVKENNTRLIMKIELRDSIKEQLAKNASCSFEDILAISIHKDCFVYTIKNHTGVFMLDFKII